jgi:hypothetical protein
MIGQFFIGSMERAVTAFQNRDQVSMQVAMATAQAFKMTLTDQDLEQLRQEPRFHTAHYFYTEPTEHWQMLLERLARSRRGGG